MASKNTLSSKKGDEGLINHFGSIRLRVTGSANLQMTLLSLDEVQRNILIPLPIQSTTSVEPTRLSNFTQQRAKLRLGTSVLGESFLISKIIIFIKPVATSWPETS